MAQHKIDYYRQDHVSLWVGQFPSVEDAEDYFTEELGFDYSWKPSAFAIELGLGFYPPTVLETHFEQMVPRPLSTLLREATFSASFIHAAVAAASAQGISEVQGITLLYDFDYQSKPNWAQAVGPMRFIGTFAFDRSSFQEKFYEMADQAGCSVAAILFVMAAWGEFMRERREEQGKEGHASAHEFCAFLQNADAETTATIIQCLPSRIAADLPQRGGLAAVLRELRLPRSEDVGRIVYTFVSTGMLRKQESDSKADFHGLFNLEE